jgi:DNA-directed RNA polymerase specialized sigma24 family protein|tara:strand:+ start:1236 stop:1763 length:528 start_codon:yes stop_codon:yes gene_type:complete
MKVVKKQHYVDNQEFLAQVIKLRDYFTYGREELGHENYKMTIKYYRNHHDYKTARDFKKCYEYLGSCFQKIANHLSYRPNFINYMYKDDMVCDGIENCIQYVENFKPEKSKNPFAYFTQIVYYAFLRRIAKEKRQLDIKDKILEKSGYDHVFTVDGDTNSDYNHIKSRLELNSKR